MRLIFTYFLLLLVTISKAQIGVGTTSPNSTLDVRGSLSLNQRSFSASTTAASTDNGLVFTGTSAATLTLPDATTCTGRVYTIKNTSATLPVPVLTIATTSSQTIDGSSIYLLDEAQKSVTLTSSGTGWNVTSVAAINKTRANYVIVKSSADFPAPVAGVVTLAANTIYEINGTITMTNKINLNGCYLMGEDANTDKIIYTPGSGELFTGSKGGTIKVLTLAAITSGSKLFNLTLASSENLIVRDANIVNCKDVGLVSGANICFFSVVNYAGNLNGITYQNITSLLLDNTAWFSTNSNTFEKLVGTFEIIEKLGGLSQASATLSAVSLDITGITSITEAGNLKNTGFTGTGTKVNGTFSKKWEVEAPGLSTEKDAVATGSLYVSASGLTDIISMNVPVKIAGTTSASDLVRFTSPANNRLMYDGTKTRTFTVSSYMSVLGASGTYTYSFYIYKNGVKVPSSKQLTSVRSSQGDIQSVTLGCTVSLAPNDYIEVWAENNETNTDVTAQTLTLIVK
ncbi:hypothetical protein [Segetibacter aerophilus]|uniref:Cell wall anchor protein n=1 Tax=Segetibacter aerophilus TaxID=670293 RepID=A0A512BGB5_9BACT|nr:hypothetical protein [Segetibacter aerophilus]GEO11008.1 hypothetical protein SAE01_35040 [Segetibacter aerophilus]